MRVFLLERRINIYKTCSWTRRRTTFKDEKMEFHINYEIFGYLNALYILKLKMACNDSFLKEMDQYFAQLIFYFVLLYYHVHDLCDPQVP